VAVPDFAPTVLELCGVAAPASMQGTSLVPLLRGERPPWREELFTEQLMDIQNYPRSESVRTREWKYIRYFKRTEDPRQAGRMFRGTLDNYNDCLVSSLRLEQPVYEELYHLGEDPGEVTNLAGDPACRPTLEHFRARVVALGRELKGDLQAPPLTVRL
jgi:arylsulfatase A-like enzyme